jgi:hypothetical protein
MSSAEKSIQEGIAHRDGLGHHVVAYLDHTRRVGLWCCDCEWEVVFFSGLYTVGSDKLVGRLGMSLGELLDLYPKMLDLPTRFDRILGKDVLS